MRINALAIVLVLGCGIAIFVMAIGMRGSLERTRLDYYASHRMADLAVSLVRAPDSTSDALRRLPGVSAIETRISGLALLDLPNVTEPASARLVSLPPQDRPSVNDLFVATGRWPDPRQAEEVVVNEAFATANDFHPGDRLQVTMHGKRQALMIVGIGNSPEFIYATPPGEIFPQQERFAVIWMSRDALERAYNLKGAFNDVAFRLTPQADIQSVKKGVDALLASFGGAGAYGRDRMASDRFLVEELGQLATMAAFLPTFFIVIAAFLVNIALTRIIASERSNIGLFKAFGYATGSVAWHYTKSALLLAIIGFVIGCIAGLMLGQSMASIYRSYYHFPRLDFQPTPALFAFALAIALGCSLIGAYAAIRMAVKLEPAEALAPPKPTAFKRSGQLLLALSHRLDAKSRIILRRTVRFPRRSLTTVIGIALAISVLVLAGAFPAVMERLIDINFSKANRQDVSLQFVDARPEAILHALERLPGVIYVEPTRTERVILRFQGRSAEEALIGLAPEARLSRLIDANLLNVTPPISGISLARALAEKLDAHAGDIIEIEQTGGRRVSAAVRIANIVDPMVGSSAYMELDGLRRFVREPGMITGANVRLDMGLYDAFTTALKEMPVLAGASFVKLAEKSMRANFDRSVGVMNLIYLSFAAIMAGGVAFSAARITLAEQERDLATLRVLGFTRLEASYVLMGELLVLAFAAIIPGVLLGTWMGEWLMDLFSNELYSFPYIFNAAGYAVAIGFTSGCVIAAALVVRSRIDRLDMVAVLKARD